MNEQFLKLHLQLGWRCMGDETWDGHCDASMKRRGPLSLVAATANERLCHILAGQPTHMRSLAAYSYMAAKRCSRKRKLWKRERVKEKACMLLTSWTRRNAGLQDSVTDVLVCSVCLARERRESLFLVPSSQGSKLGKGKDGFWAVPKDSKYSSPFHVRAVSLCALSLTPLRRPRPSLLLSFSAG